MPFQIIMLIIAVLGGVIFYFYWTKIVMKKTTETDGKEFSQQTANEFVNVKDVGEHCLYTLDNHIFAYIKVRPVCIDLLSKSEQRELVKALTAELSSLRYPFKFIAVSRPVDISGALENYWELHSEATGIRREIIDLEIKDLTNFVMKGETLERQFYFTIYNNVNNETEAEMTRRAEELVSKISLGGSGVNSELLDMRGIVQLCNLVNNPAYVHLEEIDDMRTTIAVLTQK